jgi:hypothetical protein
MFRPSGLRAATATLENLGESATTCKRPIRGVGGPIVPLRMEGIGGRRVGPRRCTALDLNRAIGEAVVIEAVFGIPSVGDVLVSASLAAGLRDALGPNGSRAGGAVAGGRNAPIGSDDATRRSCR